MATFKDDLKKEFESKRLNQEQLDKLQTIGQKQKNLYQWYGITGLIAASLLFFYVSVVSQKELRIEIAQEVAYNHNKQMPSEHLTSDYSIVRQKLDKLDFSIAAPTHLEGLTLVGARYCSIQGKTAAQLKMISGSGEVFTLYQYQLDSKFDLGTIIEIQDGVKVKMWTENGIHYALAGPSGIE